MDLLLYTSVIVCFLFMKCCNTATTIDPPEAVYSWPILEFDWRSENQTQEYIADARFIPENNPFTGIKVYKGKTYVNVPRWRLGVPSTLNVVVEKNGKPYLQPYPSWEMQRVGGDCNSFKFIQSMEIDPNTGLMWIIDTGRINIFPAPTGSQDPQNLCPPKLVIYDLNNNVTVLKYEFPTNVVNPTTTFLNDIVLDYVDGEARFAYITDTFDFKIVVYDRKQNISYFIQDLPSMSPESPTAGDITVGNISLSVGVLGINGIAMSPDFKYVYYGPVAGVGLHQVPTSLLRKRESSTATSYPEIRKVGDKFTQSDGMLATQAGRIYFPALSVNALWRWDMEKDRLEQGVSEGEVIMRTQTEVVKNDDTMQWIDTLGIDENGCIWFTAPAVHRWMTGNMDLTGASGDNFYIWKVCVNELGYLQNADVTTKDSSNGGNSPAGGMSLFVLIMHFIKRIIAHV
ncbi:protein yellow-like [Mizuhopecten yessoensis]|uniref:Protein yellow n=1 Tax=Mizuhopecten yessoensis TaxID=6573 RepID=A0A210QQN6_MIZYE|nr:protein yellow-like [Mizuhopecten yessoensis]OWF51024.1 Protein yellow [Mizuhopecten yessoensis]